MSICAVIGLSVLADGAAGVRVAFYPDAVWRLLKARSKNRLDEAICSQCRG